MKRLLYVVNIPRFFMTHRLPLALAAQSKGYEVHIATSDSDAEYVEQIRQTGLTFHPLPLSQHGTSPLAELKTVWALIKLYRDLKPDIVHQVSIKPVIYGGIAARLTGIQRVISAMSGLGYVFTGAGLKPTILRTLAKPAFRFALGGANTHMIFQNPDDQKRFVDMKLIPRERTALIRGSGVDMDVFSPQPEASGKPIVLFAGRLMWKKGVGQFVVAAKVLCESARFVIVGYAEATSPDTVSIEQLQEWHSEGWIEYWGKRDDMPDVFTQSHIVCLPSSYGEGVPKVLIEAAASGRVIITTDTPGCREIVQHRKNGLLIPPEDNAALIAALQELIQDADLRKSMGNMGREWAVANFSLKQVVEQTFVLYDL